MKEFSAVLMGHHLVAIVHHASSKKKVNLWPLFSTEEEKPILLAIDLRDHSVQEAYLKEFVNERNYSLTKFNENQIRIFGGGEGGRIVQLFQIITIESFEPLSFKYEKFNDWGRSYCPSLRNHTAQIYQDCFYVYGGETALSSSGNHPWCYDLNKQTWNLCSTSGEGPRSGKNPSSFIIEDNLYIYGTESHDPDKNKNIFVFVLNLNSMKWTQLAQKENFFHDKAKSQKLHGDISQGNLLILEENIISNDDSQNNTLCCWNIASNSWSTFEVQRIELDHSFGNPLVYKNSLFILGKNKSQLSLAILNLENLDLPVQKLPEEEEEEEHLSSLFMNENESDITFKIQDKIIPAHRSILAQKSRYFANLFNSGMIESRQQVIEIPDCEYDVFQEFVRFLYLNKVEFEINRVIKLFILADKYLQNDLRDKCITLLMNNLNFENIDAVLDFAHQQDLHDLKNWCIEFLIRIDLNKIFGLIQYLYRQQNKPEVFEDHLKLSSQAFKLVIQNYGNICQRERDHVRFFENFLIENISLQTISEFAEFISDDSSYNQKNFEQDTLNLKEAIFSFVQENLKEIKRLGINKNFKGDFLTDFGIYMIEKLSKYEEQVIKPIEGKQDNSEGEFQSVESELVKRGQKRKEPILDESSEGNPELKKTKKTL